MKHDSDSIRLSHSFLSRYRRIGNRITDLISDLPNFACQSDDDTNCVMGLIFISYKAGRLISTDDLIKLSESADLFNELRTKYFNGNFSIKYESGSADIYDVTEFPKRKMIYHNEIELVKPVYEFMLNAFINGILDTCKTHWMIGDEE